MPISLLTGSGHLLISPSLNRVVLLAAGCCWPGEPLQAMALLPWRTPCVRRAPRDSGRMGTRSILVT
jgi:hypothetical protein